VMVVELVAEQVSGSAPRRLSQLPAAGAGINGTPCAPDCCQVRRRA
jgi:ferrochelatase